MMTFEQKKAAFAAARANFVHLDDHSSEWWRAILTATGLRMIEILEIEEAEWWDAEEESGGGIDVGSILAENNINLSEGNE